jgi:hypothetical protein
MTTPSGKPLWSHLLWLVPLLILPWAGSLFFDDYQRDQRLAREGRSVQGVIVAKSTKSKGGRGGGTYYLVDYRFQPKDGGEALVEGRAKVDPDRWETLQEQQPIGVLYVPGDPSIHRADGEGPAFSVVGATAVMLLDVILLVAGLIGRARMK